MVPVLEDLSGRGISVAHGALPAALSSAVMYLYAIVSGTDSVSEIRNIEVAVYLGELYQWNFDRDRISVAFRVRCPLLGGACRLWRFHCTLIRSL